MSLHIIAFYSSTSPHISPINTRSKSPLTSSSNNLLVHPSDAAGALPPQPPMDIDNENDEDEQQPENQATASGAATNNGKKPKKSKTNLPPSAAKAQGLPHGPTPGTPLPGHMHPGLSEYEWDVRATSRHITFDATKDPEIVQQVRQG